VQIKAAQSVAAPEQVVNARLPMQGQPALPVREESVKLSAEATSLNKAVSAARSTPAVRADVVEQTRRELAQGKLAQHTGAAVEGLLASLHF